MSEQLTVDGRIIEISNSDKVLFPEKGITKRDLLDYYRRISDIMLPHLTGRPLTMQRFPDGIEGSGFYEKKAPDYFPKWIRRVNVTVEGTDGEQEQITCENEATLAYLANQACLTLHIWLSREDSLRHPDKLIFDLDPPSTDFEPVRQAAYDLEELLAEVGLKSHVMTTGSRGLHVVVALDRSAGFDAVRNFARDLAELLTDRFPDRLTIEQRKSKRRGRLFLDYLRNAYGQNSVAPYTIRARPDAPVATPLDWSELEGRELNAQSYTIENIFRRMGQKTDPWQSFGQETYALEDAQQKLSELKD